MGVQFGRQSGARTALMVHALERAIAATRAACIGDEARALRDVLRGARVTRA
jgi:hypothetical protein